MRNTSLLIFAAILALALPTDSLQQNLNQFAKTMEQLRAIPIGDMPSPDVPPAASMLLIQAKHLLRDIVSSTMNTRNLKSASPAEIESSVLGNLERAGLRLRAMHEGPGPYDREGEKFGYLNSLKISQPAGHPKLLGVVASFQIPCGDDSTLTIYQREGTLWKQVIYDASESYASVGEALGGFDYAISPPARDGSWFVIDANTGTQCASVWYGIRYHVLRPRKTPERPEILLSRTNAVTIGEDDVYKLAASADELSVDYFGRQFLDSRILARVHTDHFSVKGDHVTRIPPLALLPQDFLDEWIDLPWREAEPWAASVKMRDMNLWHERLKATDLRFYFSEFDFVQPCGRQRSPHSWQIGLAIDKDQRPADLPDEVFFTVVRKNDAFYMAGISTKRPLGCPGSASAVDTSLRHKLP